MFNECKWSQNAEALQEENMHAIIANPELKVEGSIQHLIATHPSGERGVQMVAAHQFRTPLNYVKAK